MACCDVMASDYQNDSEVRRPRAVSRTSGCPALRLPTHLACWLIRWCWTSCRRAPGRRSEDDLPVATRRTQTRRPARRGHWQPQAEPECQWQPRRQPEAPPLQAPTPAAGATSSRSRRRHWAVSPRSAQSRPESRCRDRELRLGTTVGGRRPASFKFRSQPEARACLLA